MTSAARAYNCGCRSCRSSAVPRAQDPYGCVFWQFKPCEQVLLHDRESVLAVCEDCSVGRVYGVSARTMWI